MRNLGGVHPRGQGLTRRVKHGEQVRREMETVLAALQGVELESGIRLAVSSDRTPSWVFYPPPQLVRDSDEDLFHAGEERYRISFANHGGGQSLEAYRAEVIASARIDAGTRLIGGTAGITDRSLKEIETEILPGITPRLARERGKVVFLGNGFSSAPLGIALRHGSGKLSHAPVVVDLLDYPALRRDFTAIRAALEAERLPFPFVRQQGQVNGLLQAQAAGTLVLVVHCLGEGPTPPSARGAQLAINSWGPPEETLREQVELLAPGGELWTSNMPKQWPPDVTVTPIPRKGHVVRRER